jgi:AraC-like DNA-binding protein
VVCGARLTGDLDLQANVDMGDRDSRRFLDSAPSRVIYKAKALDQVNRLSNKPWRNFFNSMTNPLLSSRLKTAPWTYRTYLMILKHFEDGLSLSMEAVSNSLGADVSTLRRYLQAESTGFKHLITLFRYQQAQLMIIDGVSIEQMARSLDFKNPVSVKRLVRSKGFCGEDATALRDAGN